MTDKPKLSDLAGIINSGLTSAGKEGDASAERFNADAINISTQQEQGLKLLGDWLKPQAEHARKREDTIVNNPLVVLDDESFTPGERLEAAMNWRRSMRKRAPSKQPDDAYLVRKLPFAGPAFEAAEFADTALAMKRMKSGDATGDDYATVARLLERYENEEKWTMVDKITDMAAEIPGFAFEMAVSRGAGLSAGKWVTRKILSKMGKEAFGHTTKGAALRFGARAAGFAARAGTQAINPAMAPRTIENFASRRLPELEFSQDEDGRRSLDVKDGDNDLVAMLKAYGDTTIEVGSEALGEKAIPAIFKGPVAYAFNRLSVPSQQKALAIQAVLKANWKRITGGGETEFAKILKAGGWNGVATEVLEERAGELARGLTIDPGEFGVIGAIVRGEAGDAGEQLLTEAAAFSLPLAGHAVARAASSDADGRVRSSEDVDRERILGELEKGQQKYAEYHVSRQQPGEIASEPPADVQFSATQPAPAQDESQPDAPSQGGIVLTDPQTGEQIPINEKPDTVSGEVQSETPAQGEVDERQEEAPQAEVLIASDELMDRFFEGQGILDKTFGSRERRIRKMSDTEVAQVAGWLASKNFREEDFPEVLSELSRRGIANRFKIESEIIAALETQRGKPSQQPSAPESEAPQAETLKPFTDAGVERLKLRYDAQDAEVVEPSGSESDAAEYVKQFGGTPVFVKSGKQFGAATYKSPAGNIVYVQSGQGDRALWSAVADEVGYLSQAGEGLLEGDELAQRQDAYLAGATPAYRQHLEANPAQLKEEAEAAYVAEFLLNTELQDKVRAENPTLFGRILEYIRKALGGFVPKSESAQKILERLSAAKIAPVEAKRKLGDAPKPDTVSVDETDDRLEGESITLSDEDAKKALDRMDETKPKRKLGDKPTVKQPDAEPSHEEDDFDPVADDFDPVASDLKEKQSEASESASRGPNLYRETSLNEAEAYIPGSQTSTGYTFGAPDLHYSDNPDLAIGQGKNRGVILEFEDHEAKRERVKPGTQVPGVGKEWIIRERPEAMRDKLLSVTIKPDAKKSREDKPWLIRARRNLKSQGWIRTDNEDGSETWTKPNAAPTAKPDTLSVPSETVAAEVEQPEAEKPKRKLGDRKRKAPEPAVDELSDLEKQSEGMWADIERLQDQDKMTEASQLMSKVQKIDARINELTAPQRKAEADRLEQEKEAARKKWQSKEEQLIAELPVYQRRNGWEIVKHDPNYILRDPNTKEEIYSGKLKRVREVADESAPDAPEPDTSSVAPPEVQPEPQGTDPEIPKLEKHQRTTPEEGSIERGDWRDEVAQYEERRRRLETKIRELTKQRDALRRNAHKKRGAIQKDINSLGRQQSDIRQAMAPAERKLDIAFAEDRLENPPSYDHYLSWMARLSELNHKQAEAEKFSGELIDRAAAMAKARGLNDAEAKWVGQTAESGFRNPSNQMTLKEYVDKAYQMQVDSRLGALTHVTNSRKHLTDEQKQEFRKRGEEAIQDHDGWLKKIEALQEEARMADAAAEKAEREVREAESRKHAAEAAEKAAEETKAKRQSNKRLADQRRYWKQLPKRASQLKGEKRKVAIKVDRGTKENPIPEETEVKADVFGVFAIHPEVSYNAETEQWEKDKGYALLHLPTGGRVVSPTSVAAGKQLIQFAQDLDINLGEIAQNAASEKASDEDKRNYRRLLRMWESETFDESNISDEELAKLLATSPKPDVHFDADIVLDSSDLGEPGERGSVSKEAIGVLKNFAAEVPEFAYDPVFTADDKGNLVFQDGFKFTFKPSQFMLAEGELEPGQTVGFNLTDLGIKPITDPVEMVRAVLSNHGLKSTASGDTITVKRSLAPVTIKVTKLSATTDTGDKYVREIVERIRFRQPGQVGAKPDTVSGSKPVEPIEPEGMILNPGDYVKAVTSGGVEFNGDVSSIMDGIVYVIPDGTQNSVPAKVISVERPSRKTERQQDERDKKSKPAVAKMAEPTKQTYSRKPTGTEKANIAAADIIKTWERLFGVPIRIGGFSQRAVGIYKFLEGRSPDIIRMKESHYANLAVAAHEVAHHIDNLTGIVDHLPKNLANELAGLDYEPKGRTFEGFAEFVRHYVTETDAESLAPKFHKWFTETWMPGNEKWQSSLNKAQTHARQYADQSVFQRIRSLIGTRPGDDLDFAARWVKKAKSAVGRFMTAIVDDLGALRVVQDFGESKGSSKQVYNMAMSARYRAPSEAARAFEHGVQSVRDGHEIGKVGLWSLAKHLENDAEYDEAVAYAYARHTLYEAEHNPNYNTGMSIEDAESWLEYVEGDPAKEARYESFARELSQFNNDLLGMLVDAGALSQESMDKMIQRYGDNYFPLHRVLEDGIGLFGSSGSKFVNLPAAIRGRSRAGSGRQIIDPLDATIRRAVAFYNRALQARVAHELIETLDPTMGGVGGGGFLLDRLDPGHRVTEGTISEILDTLVSQEIVDEDDAKAMKIAAKIRNGETVGKRSLEWFAARHNIADEADYDEFLEAAQQEPDALATISLWRSDYTPNAAKATVMIHDREGNPIMYELDRDLYRVATGMDQMHFAGFMGIMHTAARWFKTGSVGASTGFGAKNLIRDFVSYQGRANTKGAESVTKPVEYFGRYIAHKARKLGGLEADNAYIDLFEELGGKLYSPIGHTMEARTRSRRQKMAKSRMSKFGVTVSRPTEAAANMIEAAQEVIAFTDAPPRLAEMESAIKAAGYEVRDNQWYHTETNRPVDRLPEEVRVKAAMAIGEATVNFKRIGSAGRYIEAFIPFFNANVQSLYRQSGLVGGLRKLGDKGDDGKKARRYLIYLAAIASATALYYLLRHDDDYREQDQYLREGYWTWGRNGRTYLRMPKPHEEAIVANTVELLMDKMYHPSDAGELLPSDVTADELSNSLILRDFFGRVPQGGGALRGGAEVMMDYDFFRGRELTPEYMKQDPAEQQFTPYTSSTSKWLGQFTGPRLGLSPIQMEHLINSTTGGFYQRTAGAIEATAEGKLDTEHLPFVRGVAMNRYQVRSISDFYDEWGAIKLQMKREEATDSVSGSTADKKAEFDDVAALMSAIRRLDKKDLQGRRAFAYEPYLVGLSREALGREPLEMNPSPFAAGESVPSEIKAVLAKFTKNKAESAILSHGYPLKATEGLTYDETVKEWEKTRKADEAWLRAHKRSPIVRQVIDEVRESKSYRDLLSRKGKPEWLKSDEGDEYMQKLTRWIEKVDRAQAWLGEAL